ncbi:carboxypeptidase-like regulatory domain-containing protein [Mucilaginibacter sp.]|uniref:carboxypeptidase-like regulatory domain-containing protein n=1 Tax=Mucilaginibacter sp. TaxID=1882438 RepID=UPI003D0E3FE1
MRFPWLILFYLLVPFATLAQNGIISGTIVNSETKKPLPRASVFLSNSSVGSATAEDGKYTLYGVRPGQYTLVVTILGYEQYSKSVLVGNEPIKLNIELAPKPLMLREVVIASSADWKKNYEAFRKDFIGTDLNAKSCFVMNPHILNITYNPTKQVLHADADEFLIVENKALGYRVKYLVNDFKVDHISGIVSREGQQVFEDLPGSEAQKKKWHQKREEAYYGSAMHFYRSLYMDKLAEDGFVVYKYTRYLNPERPSDDVIRRKIKIFRDMGKADSGNYYIGLANMSKYYHENVQKPPYSAFEIFYKSDQPGIYAIHFQNYLYVTYTRRRDDTYDRDLYRPLDMSNFETSVITLSAPYALFDTNGIIVANSPLYEGAWARAKVSDLLPVDYVPDAKY